MLVFYAEQFILCLSSDPKNIATSWFSRHLISFETFDETCEINETSSDKARRLYREALKLVRQNPDKYQSVIESFQGRELFSDLIKLLNSKYGKTAFP